MQTKFVIVFISQFYPAYKNGGPLLSISNYLSLGLSGINFKVITKPSNTKSVKINSWQKLNNYEVFVSKSLRTIRSLLLRNETDIYYLNSLFDFKYSIAIVLMMYLGLIPKKRILLAPRGELSQGALSLKSMKKRTFLTIVKLLKMYEQVIWHASSSYERDEIMREFGDNALVKIARDIPNLKLINEITRKSKVAGSIKLIFISRIDRKKNLLYVLESLKLVKGSFELDIYGPIEDKSYWKKCWKVISQYLTPNVRYCGMVNNSVINSIYPKYDLFFFPTLGENFGHVIFESLALGVPVLCSNKTPWDKLEDFGAGWSYDLSRMNLFVERIEHLITIGEEEFSHYREGALKYSRFIMEDQDNIEANLSLFDFSNFQNSSKDGRLV